MADSPAMKEILYPESKPFHEGTLKVDEYTLPYKEFGNPDGIPIVHLHGGPGAGSGPYFSRFFDPKVFHIIIYDQRGAGESTPAGGLENNTPDLLVDDLHKLKEHLGIDQWHVFGGSWGSTLALLYAEKYPDSVKSLILRGVYMLRQKDDDLMYQAIGTCRPETIKRFREFLPENERGNVIESYYQRLFNPDPAISLPAAREIERYENSAYTLEPMSEEDLSAFDPKDINGIRIEWAFIRNQKFDPQDRILQDVGKIRDIPTMIVQGRYDMTCPPPIAFALKQVFPEAQLQMVTSGHAATDPEMMRGLVQATNRIRDTGSPLLQTQQRPAPSRKNVLTP